MINTVSFSVMTEISSYFTRNTNFDIWMAAPDSADREFTKKLCSISGVNDVYPNLMFNNVEVLNSKEKIREDHMAVINENISN